MGSELLLYLESNGAPTLPSFQISEEKLLDIIEIDYVLSSNDQIIDIYYDE